ASLGRLDEAVNAYQHAIHHRSDFAAAQNNLGLALRALNRSDDALAWFLAASLCAKDSAAGMANAAGLLRDTGHLHEALDLYRKAIAARPRISAIRSNYVYAMHLAEYYDEQMIYREHVE